MKLIQIRYQIWYRIRVIIRSLLKLKYKMSIDKEGFPIEMDKWIEKNNSFKNFEFEFLNHNISYLIETKNGDFNSKIDWNEKRSGKLWAYNLNYMDYLLQPKMDRKTGLQLIQLFIDDIGKNAIGMEPYPISLRSINWIKFITSCSNDGKDLNNQINLQIKKINASLYAQYQILLDNLEYHLCGNHLLENAFSLLFGAFYFQDNFLWNKSINILKSELEEQILPDGAHIELSPMYQQIILDRLLDCCNLLKNNYQFQGQQELFTLIEKKAVKMHQWLNCMTFVNGEIPLFNDATNSIAPKKNQLDNYVIRLGIAKCNCLKSSKLYESGYRKFIKKNYECIFDIDGISPAYQPGHSHADTFNFELFIKGKPVIVDTGVSTYNAGYRRSLERGSSSHNTVTIGHRNSSKVWASHRVGKRALVDIKIDEPNLVFVSHNGYSEFNKTIYRKFESGNNYLLLTDVIESQNKLFNGSKASIRQRGVSHLHFHPNRQVVLKDGIILIDNLAEITCEGMLNIKLDEYNYAPEFNKLLQSLVCEITFENRLLLRINVMN